MLIEVCCNSLQSALNAQKAGAHRIELCSNLMAGGTTPSAATIQMARAQLEIELFVLLRPRPGDFTCSNLEIELLAQDLQLAKVWGVDGVVFGVLTAEGKIDLKRNRQLVKLAQPMATTFHRAFDLLPHPFEALETLIDLGFNRVLSSGQAATALEGKKCLQQLNAKANGRIGILPGGGISAENASELVTFTKVSEIHLSGKKLKGQATQQQKEASKNITFGPNNTLPEWAFYETSETQIKAVVDLF